MWRSSPICFGAKPPLGVRLYDYHNNNNHNNNNTYLYVFGYGIRDPRFDISRVEVMRTDRSAKGRQRESSPFYFSVLSLSRSFSFATQVAADTVKATQTLK